jgi:hypothetical protein
VLVGEREEEWVEWLRRRDVSEEEGEEMKR